MTDFPAMVEDMAANILLSRSLLDCYIYHLACAEQTPWLHVLIEYHEREPFQYLEGLHNLILDVPKSHSVEVKGHSLPLLSGGTSQAIPRRDPATSQGWVGWRSKLKRPTRRPSVKYTSQMS